jgi:hypothetical protein
MIINPYAFGVSYDPDAQAFFTASGLTGATNLTAINNLVVALKGFGIWTKMKAIYPMIGGTAALHKWNLKDPRDLNAAFRLTFNGGWTHTAQGAQSNGTNAFANTFANLSTDFTLYSAHYSYYIRNNTNTGADIGVTEVSPFVNEGWSAARLNNFSYGGFYNQDDAGVGIKVVSSESRGFWVNSITSNVGNNTFLTRNLTTIGTAPPASTPANTTIYIGAIHQRTPDAAVAFSDHQYSFAGFGNGLTIAEANNFYTAVNAYQVALSRNV